MCGIFAYYNFKVERNRKAILDFLFTGLRRLEYRGYDSAGICIDSDLKLANGHGLALTGDVGNGALSY
jgi:glutamine---fructose-6-phosphate transaminase (isomerizing)